MVDGFGGRTAEVTTGGRLKGRRIFFENSQTKWIDTLLRTDMIGLPRDGELVPANSTSWPPLSVVSVFLPTALQCGRPSRRLWEPKEKAELATRPKARCSPQGNAGRGRTLGWIKLTCCELALASSASRLEPPEQGRPARRFGGLLVCAWLRVDLIFGNLVGEP